MHLSSYSRVSLMSAFTLFGLNVDLRFRPRRLPFLGSERIIGSGREAGARRTTTMEPQAPKITEYAPPLPKKSRQILPAIGHAPGMGRLAGEARSTTPGFSLCVEHEHRQGPARRRGFLARAPQPSSNIQIRHRERVVLDEFAPRLDLVAHQSGEQRVGRAELSNGQRSWHRRKDRDRAPPPLQDHPCLRHIAV